MSPMSPMSPIRPMRKLRIAQIAPIWYSVPPKKYGGIERIVHYLTEGLVRRGHYVTLFASGDSKTKAKLLSCRARCLSKDKISWEDFHWSLENLSFAFKRAAEFDIVHSHTGLRTLFFQDLVKTPVLHTFHNPIAGKRKELPPVLEILERRAGQTNVCFISKEAKKICPIKTKRSWLVYNGIDLVLFKFSATSKDELLWAGRVEEYKGIENAIRLAQMAKMRLNLVGKLDPEKKQYFEKKIKPHLSEKIRYLGELSQRELVPLYQSALAFIYPIEWPEPFGLTMVEAQACGTPVVVFDKGSAREVVQDKKTGFVVPFLNEKGEKNYQGLLAALKNIRDIKREDCRAFIEENFTIKKMLDNYEKIYFELTEKHSSLKL